MAKGRKNVCDENVTLIFEKTRCTDTSNPSDNELEVADTKDPTDLWYTENRYRGTTLIPSLEPMQLRRKSAKKKCELINLSWKSPMTPPRLASHYRS